MGSGPEIILCLHGYGESMHSFDVLQKHLERKYTLVCIDLPFHGETEWNEGLLLPQGELLEIIETVLKEIGFSNTQLSLLGFSLGGRIALQLVQIIPGRIKHVVLLAPDGLRLNFWYWLGTQTYPGNKLFHATMQNPSWFFKMVAVAYKLNLLNKSIVKLVHYYLDDKEERILLYTRWITLRKLKPRLAVVKRNIALYKIPTRFVFGSYDRIILCKRSKTFKTDTDNVKIIMLETGHQLLKEKFAGYIMKQFST